MKRLLNSIFICTCFMGLYCSALRQSPVVTKDDNSLQEFGAEKTADSPADSMQDTHTPDWLPVKEWEGENFLFLAINPFFRKYGFDLRFAGSADSAQLLRQSGFLSSDNRLLPQDSAAMYAVVQSVDSIDSEFALTFLVHCDTMKIHCSGVTVDGAIKGLVRERDLLSARNEWVGKTVYAAKRSVNTYNAQSGVMGSFKVSLHTPLTVTAVTRGMSPMPPHPLWVHVRAPDERVGFIPVFFSWTNAPESHREEKQAWVSSLLFQDPKTLYTWPEHIWKAIDDHNLHYGMNPQQVLFSWGAPLEQVREDHGGEIIEKWRFSAQRLIFKNDSLALIEGL